MIASVKQGESVSSERYKKKRKRQKKTDDLAHGAGDHMKQEDGREAGMIGLSLIHIYRKQGFDKYKNL